jgi:hypothetical protein
MATPYELACIEGVQTAFDLHVGFSGGLPLSFAPEAFIQGQIALALAALGLMVTLESPVYETLCEAGADLRGRPFKRIGGRLDLVTWWKNGTPRHLIEVKMLRHSAAIADDIKRLKSMLLRGGSQQGLILVYAEAKKAETVRGRIDKAKALQYSQLAKRSGVRPFKSAWIGDDDWHWEAACLRVLPE